MAEQKKSLDQIFTAKPTGGASGSGGKQSLDQIFTPAANPAAAQPAVDPLKPTSTAGAIIRAVVEPFARFGRNITSGIRGGAALAKAGLQYIGGDKEGAKQTIIEEGQKKLVENTVGTPAGAPGSLMRQAGNFRPYGAEYQQPGHEMTTGELLKTSIGGGLEVGSRALPIGEAVAGGTGAAIASGQILKSMGKGAVAGGVTGLLGATGSALATDKTLKEGAQEAGIATLGGAFIGGISSGILAAVVKTYNGVGNIWTRWRLAERQAEIEKQVADDLIEGIPADTVGPGAAGAPGRVSRPALTKDEVSTIKMAKTSGMSSGDIGMIRNATPEELSSYNDMLKTAEKNIGVRSPTVRPVEKAGNVIVNQLDVVDKIRADAGSALDDAINAMPDKPLDITSVRASLLGDLSDNGVQLRGDGSLDFRASAYAKDNATQTELNNLWNDLRPNANGDVLRTPERIVNIRRRLFNALDVQKDVLTPIESIMTGVRRDLNDYLIDIGGGPSGGYAQASQQYAQSRQLLTDFYKTVGFKYVEGNSPVRDLRVGTVMERMLGNNSAPYVDLLMRTQDILGKNGFRMTENPMNLLRFNSLLEDVYGSTQPNALAGRVQQGVSNAISAGADVAKGNLGSAAAKTAVRAFGIRDEALRGALKELLGFFLRAASR